MNNFTRVPKYLSPTSVMQWKKDRMEFYRKYLGPKIPRMPQTEAMSVGSAFDAYVKNYLATNLGMPEAKDELDLDYLLTEQVEEHNRDFAFAAGQHCFDEYKELGACAELMKELEIADKVAFHCPGLDGVHPEGGKAKHLHIRAPVPKRIDNGENHDPRIAVVIITPGIIRPGWRLRPL